MPFGLDLEWETDGGVYAVDSARPATRCRARVHGEILVGRGDRSPSTASASGITAWGVRDWWTFGWVLDGRGASTTAPGSTRPACGSPAWTRSRPGYVQPPGGTPEQIEVCTAEEDLDENGFPGPASLSCGPLDLSIEPVAFSPVHLVDDDGSGPRHARFPRALCRFEAADGRNGVGWTEWQPAGLT